MSDFRRLDDRISVAPQLSIANVAAAKAAGFAVVINNRPDGEEPSAPQGGEIAEACAAAGLAYHAIPVGHAGFSREQVDATARLLAEADGPVLAYCRSGTRSCFLWALASAQAGDDLQQIAAKANAAGYDVSPVLR